MFDFIVWNDNARKKKQKENEHFVINLYKILQNISIITIIILIKSLK